MTADGTIFLNGALFGRDIHDPYPRAAAATFVHETLHTFGLPDLWHFGNEPPQSMDFVGGWSIMSSKLNLPGLLAWERLQLGWLRADELACIDTAKQATVALAPLELTGGTRAVIVKQRSGRSVVGEARKPIGEDATVCDSGLLLYTVDPTVEDGAGAIRVQPGASDHGSRNWPSCSLFYRAAYRSDRATQAAFESGGITFTPVKPKPGRCRVSLAITRDFVARGRVRSALARCARNAAVAIQVRRGKSWRRVRATRAKADGTFRVRLSRRAGVYRAFVRARSGCRPAFSPAVKRTRLST